MTHPSGRSSTGLDPSLAGALAYLAGAISGIVLLVMEKESRFVRFHAAQSTVFFVIVFVLHLMIPALPVVGGILYPFFFLAVIGLWFYLMFQAVRGRMYKLPYLGDFADSQIR